MKRASLLAGMTFLVLPCAFLVTQIARADEVYDLQSNRVKLCDRFHHTV